MINKNIILLFFLLVPLCCNAFSKKSSSQGYGNSDKAKYNMMIYRIESKYNIPKGLLLAISKAETGVMPWALNVGGKAIYSSSKLKVFSIINNLLKKDIDNFDVGIMQLNFKWHGMNFSSINDMLDPIQNINYAAKFLVELKEKYKSWHLAVKYYHSSNTSKQQKYVKKVSILWLKDKNSASVNNYRSF